MERYALTILKEDCCGCHACEVACKQEHGLGVGPRFIRVIEKSPSFIPVYCRHCADAPCRKACPVGAIRREGKGIVLVDEETCIGCRECVAACPFGAMQFEESREVAVKCDLCVDRQRDGLPPACSTVCLTGCIIWGTTAQVLERKAGDRR